MRYARLETTRGSFGVRLHGSTSAHPGAPLARERERTVLCVHGFPDDASTYDDLGARLAQRGYRVAAVNLRGYAPSPAQGSLALVDLVEDLAAVADALSPDTPVDLIGHDYGAQLAYPLLARRPGRFHRAVLVSGAHPALVQRNARRSLRQLWMSRYIVFFQLGAVADSRVARDDFAYVEQLWRRWSPGTVIPAAHRAEVKETLRRSMPQPVAMYRAGSFSIPTEPIAVPTLYVTGADDGCALPFLADGQERLFTAGYERQTWEGVGHYPHLERPGQMAETVMGWLRGT